MFALGVVLAILFNFGIGLLIVLALATKNPLPN
jgi:hypothetical protein